MEGAAREPLFLASLAEFNVTPLGFLSRAREFLDASVLLSEKSGRFSFVAAFLACRAIELTLKSYLLLNGDDVKQVKARGHDLTATLTICKARGIDAVVDLTAAELALLERSNKYYLGHEFAYFDVVSSISRPRDPDLAMLAPIADKLLNAVEERYDGPRSEKLRQSQLDSDSSYHTAHGVKQADILRSAPSEDGARDHFRVKHARRRMR